MIYRDDRPRRKVCRCSRRIRPGRRILLTCSSCFSGFLPRIPYPTDRCDSPLRANASQNIVHTSLYMCRRAGESIEESERETRGVEDSVMTERKRRRTILSEDLQGGNENLQGSHPNPRCNLPANLISRYACTNLQEFRTVLPLSRLFSVCLSCLLHFSPRDQPYLSLSLLPLPPPLSLSLSLSLSLLCRSGSGYTPGTDFEGACAMWVCTTRLVPSESPSCFSRHASSLSARPPPGVCLRFFPPRRIRGSENRRQMVFRAVGPRGRGRRSHNWSCNTCYRRYVSFLAAGERQTGENRDGGAESKGEGGERGRIARRKERGWLWYKGASN